MSLSEPGLFDSINAMSTSFGNRDKDKGQMSARFSKSDLLSSAACARLDMLPIMHLISMCEGFLGSVAKRSVSGPPRGLALFVQGATVDDDTQMFVAEPVEAAEMSRVWKPLLEALRSLVEVGKQEGGSFPLPVAELAAAVGVLLHKACAQPFSSEFSRLTSDDHSRAVNPLVAAMETRDAGAILETLKAFSGAYRTSSQSTTLLEILLNSWVDGSSAAATLLSWISRLSGVPDQAIIFSLFGGGVADVAENVAHSMLHGDAELLEVLSTSTPDVHGAFVSFMCSKTLSSQQLGSGTAVQLWTSAEEPPFLSVLRAKPAPLLEGLMVLATSGFQEEVAVPLAELMVCADVNKAHGLLRTLVEIAQEAVLIPSVQEKSYRLTIRCLRQVLAIVCVCSSHLSALLCSLSGEETGGRAKMSSRHMGPVSPTGSTPKNAAAPISTSFAGCLSVHFPGGVFPVSTNSKAIDAAARGYVALMQALSTLSVGTFPLLQTDTAIRVTAEEMKYIKSQVLATSKAAKLFRSRNPFMKNLSTMGLNAMEQSSRRGQSFGPGGGMRRSAMSMRVQTESSHDLTRSKSNGVICSFPSSIAAIASDDGSASGDHAAPQFAGKALDSFLSRMERAVTNREPAVYRQAVAAREVQRAQHEKDAEERRRFVQERFFHRRLHATRVTESWAAESRQKLASEMEALDKSVNTRAATGTSAEAAVSTLLTPRTKEILEAAKRHYAEERRSKPRVASEPRALQRTRKTQDRQHDTLNSSAPLPPLKGSTNPSTRASSGTRRDAPPRTPTPQIHGRRQESSAARQVRPLPPPSREGPGSAAKNPSDKSGSPSPSSAQGPAVVQHSSRSAVSSGAEEEASAGPSADPKDPSIQGGCQSSPSSRSCTPDSHHSPSPTNSSVKGEVPDGGHGTEILDSLECERESSAKIIDPSCPAERAEKSTPFGVAESAASIEGTGAETPVDTSTEVDHVQPTQPAASSGVAEPSDLSENESSESAAHGDESAAQGPAETALCADASDSVQQNDDPEDDVINATNVSNIPSSGQTAQRDSSSEAPVDASAEVDRSEPTQPADSTETPNLSNPVPDEGIAHGAGETASDAVSEAPQRAEPKDELESLSPEPRAGQSTQGGPSLLPEPSDIQAEQEEKPESEVSSLDYGNDVFE
jgi:hypothetical protein